MMEGWTCNVPQLRQSCMAQQYQTGLPPFLILQDAPLRPMDSLRGSIPGGTQYASTGIHRPPLVPCPARPLYPPALPDRAISLRRRYPLIHHDGRIGRRIRRWQRPRAPILYLLAVHPGRRLRVINAGLDLVAPLHVHVFNVEGVDVAGEVAEQRE